MQADVALAAWEDAVALAGRLWRAESKTARLLAQEEALTRHGEVMGVGYAARVLEGAMRIWRGALDIDSVE